MKIYKNPQKSEWATLIKRPAINFEVLNDTVREVFEDVKRNQDKSLIRFTRLFDRVSLPNVKVEKEELVLAAAQCKAELKAAIDAAAENIRRFHARQSIAIKKVETGKGVVCWQESRPIEKVGIYVPGGSAPLFSTVLMLGIPAQLAGCKTVVLCTPPTKNGELNPAIAYAALSVGIKTVFKVGGVQAIAAMALGTPTVPAVYKIVGPGNQFVTAGKNYAQQLGVAIDMPAGPSELLILADDTAPVNFVAADLLSQAEHGADSQVILVADTAAYLKAVQGEVKRQLEELPRKNLAQKALENACFLVLTNEDEQMDFINAYAPEHLLIMTENPTEKADKIMNAGSVFLGQYTPESAGDYASGTNHTLPTGGFARMYSGVNLDAFSKKITFQEITPEGLKGLGKTIETMASAEGLEGHGEAVRVRLTKIAEQ